MEKKQTNDNNNMKHVQNSSTLTKKPGKTK